MTIPAWQLISWKPVLTTLPEFRRALKHMRPVSRVGGEDSAAARLRRAPRRGQALWAVDHHGLRLGLAWEWAEVREDVVALCDPMKVLSNVRLILVGGVLLGEGERLVHLNSAIHELDWQAHVVPPQRGWAQPMAA